ncbi:MEF2-activating motif and SAP domain-containing transcriptional regulator isoform X2 [Channa argus]|uniref:MEF2-activating motif and SAP domain-containing transcriptional regulator isoform X2 n=1 Tax=Channa argus TaxID=215402 RepID=UPI003522EA3E
MTLLASERSLLIRNKFRSVLQLRIQNRRQNEINADPGLKSASPTQKPEKNQSEALCLTDDGATQKLPSCGLNTETAQERTVCGAQRQKKACQAHNLTERLQHPPGPVEQQQKHALPPENRPASFPLSADVFEDDILSCSSSSPTEQHGVHQSPTFSSLPGLSGDQLLSDFSALGPPLNHSPSHTQSCLALLPATEGMRQPLSVTLSESNSMATTGRPNGMYLTSQSTPLLPKVSELRQQLRKRGLPVSGTKPALLQRLRPFQLHHACLIPAPICQQLGTKLEPLTPCPPLPPNQSPSSSSISGPDSPSSSPNQQLYIQDRGVPNGILSNSPNGTMNTMNNSFTNAVSVSLAGEQGGLSNTVLLATASTASGTPSPSLPMSSSSPLQCGTRWRTKNEQQQQQLNVELEMRERIRRRPRDRSANAGTEPCGGSLHPFLQQDPGCARGKLEADAQTEVLFTQVFCCQPCDVIGQDLELPVQITASPVQTLPNVRSLEEELQEAIQKAQMDPRQSIDDILDEPISCVGSVSVSDHKSPAHSAPGPSAPPQADQSPASQQHNKDDSFLPSPLCSSLLLELPPSPAVINPSQVIPAPLPPPICTSPLPSTGKSRKRRAPTPFDAADWLETLTSGLRPLTPPKAPFVETDFSLDSDLNVNRVLDLMIEQW